MGGAEKTVWLVAGGLYALVESVARALTSMVRESVARVNDGEEREQQRLRQRLPGPLVDDGQQTRLAAIRLRSSDLSRRR